MAGLSPARRDAVRVYVGVGQQISETVQLHSEGATVEEVEAALAARLALPSCAAARCGAPPGCFLGFRPAFERGNIV